MQPNQFALATALASAGVLAASPIFAVEGGTSAYLLGSRDSFAGIVPGPGTYVGVDLVTFSGDITGVSLGGLPIAADTTVDVNLVKLSFTQVLEGQIWGGTPAFNVNIPFVDASLSYVALRPPVLTGRQIEDSTSGVGDITVTPILGWHRGNLHYSAAFSIFMPTGSYQTASVDLQNRTVKALNTGKNRWAFQPVFALTHFDPKTGFEVSGATSLLFSEKNDATDYQTAPAFTLEATAMQHLPSGFAFGLTGYWYEQLSEDSGLGADATRAALGIDSLKASAMGIGPIVSYNTELFGNPLSLKLKYYHEFNVERRFESDVLWLNATMTF